MVLSSTNVGDSSSGDGVCDNGDGRMKLPKIIGILVVVPEAVKVQDVTWASNEQCDCSIQ
jgi:hypothetical protein